VVTKSNRDVDAKESAKGGRTLRLLIADNDDTEAELLVRALKRAGYAVEFVRVDQIDDFAWLLQEVDYDLVLSNHQLRDGTGMDALAVVKKSVKKAPFIVVTDILGDEAAVNYIKSGASDYVLKNRLDRLPSAVGRVLQQVKAEADQARLRESIVQAKRDWEMTFDAVPDPVFLVDKDCGTLRANLAAERLGFQLGDLLGNSCDDILGGEGTARSPSSLPRLIRFDIQEPCSGRFFELTSTPVRDSSDSLVMCVIVLRDITARKRAEERLHRSEEQLRGLASRLQTSAEQERLRIARELHDQLGQALTGIKMDLDWVTRKHASEPDTTLQKVRETIQLVDSIIGLVRKLATELRPGMLDTLGITAAVEWQVEEFQRRTGVRCSTQLPQIKLDLSTDQQIAMFRIVQESLTNVARHAGATAVHVALENDGERAILTVQDNGRGFAAETLEHTKSLGVVGMRERLIPLGGELRVQSSPGSGTKVTACVPLKPPM